MHDCPDCGQACDCDGEDLWTSMSEDCDHLCDDLEDDLEDDLADDEDDDEED